MSAMMRHFRWTKITNSRPTDFARRYGIGRDGTEPDYTGRDARTRLKITLRNSHRRAAFAILAAVLFAVAPATRGQATDGGSQNDIRDPVTFVAGDSLVLFIRGDTKSASLYGNSSLIMADATLKAFQIDILFARNEVLAHGIESDSVWVGRPEFTRGTDIFVGESLAYNLRTKRGRVVGAETRYEEGFIRGGVVKALEDSVIFIEDGVYTTCECTVDPSYSLRSKKMKLVNQKWIYTGPLQLYLFNIPTPLWLPFGFLPAKDTRRSGPLPPSYGEDEFGFYLRDWGWYFAMNDYMDLQLQAGFWTNGSWQSRTLFRYRKRYGFDGQLQVSLARFKNGEKNDPNFSIKKTGAFRWSHTQTIGPTASFNANVNLSSSGYLRGVSQNYDDRTRQSIQSTLRFTKRWSSRNLSILSSQTQVLDTDEVNMTLPSISFSQRSFKPFYRSSRAPGESERFYEKLTVSYNMSLNNRFSFRPLSAEELIAAGDSAATRISWFDALTSAKDYRRATGKDEQFDFKASHRIPVSAPFSIQRLPLLGDFRLNLTPSITYTEDWFLNTDRRMLSSDSLVVETRSESEFFALRQYTASMAASTTFYGIFPLRIGPYQTIRHTVRPSVSFNFRPDFFSDRFNYTRTYTDANGEEVRYAVVNGVGRGSQKSLAFSLNNTFETKRVAADSADVSQRQGRGSVKLLDLNVTSSYNFAADSLGFSSILLNARTRLFGQVDVNFRSAFSPYQVSDTGQLINKYAFSFPKAPLGRMTRADLTIRTSVRSARGDGSRPLVSPRAGFNAGQADPFNPTASFFQTDHPTDYADFSIPWSLALDFSYGVTKTGVSSIRRAILNTTFDFSLTPNWKVASRTGYDFERNKLVTTTLAIARDFDCWQMSFNWIPFGDFQSWGFDLHVKSSHLRDLLRIRQPRLDVRNRFGSLL